MAQNDKIALSHSVLREHLHYDPETGIWTWLKPRAQWISPGAVAGATARFGTHQYRVIKIFQKIYLAHRLAFFYVTGGWPENEIDHKNGNGLDNRWQNLRPATRQQNGQNQRLSRSNTTGLKGVTWVKRRRVYAAGLKHNKKYYFLGHFNCPAAAHFAYVVAAERKFQDFARHA